MAVLFYSNEQNQMTTELNRLDFEPMLSNLLYGNAMYSEETNQKSNNLLKTLKGLVNQSLVNTS